ncbi:SixA phosphatase family protein [Granulicella sibirica]|uniref:Phosphohistidine phosphatase, SixA n=1 Tax=Granulicella sibirica TaxID=2479048 RepID=A0A4Q0T716_9BACT|nr:phosphoglycerate mutase family protein [Granulicella sibirica]RXH57456.1 phosphohistidine phosphatase, SixA [Granulicella sibirica]
MNLFILRHASAGTRRVNPLLDKKRPLDKEGKQYCLQLAQVLQSVKIQFDVILSSPLKRALQTAQLVGTESGYDAPVLLSDALAPSGTVEGFHKLVQEIQVHENVLVVGHSPNIEAFLASMLVPNNSTSGRFRLRKGSLARISMQRGSNILTWMLDPRIVRALYATSTKSSRRKTSRK